LFLATLRSASISCVRILCFILSITLSIVPLVAQTPAATAEVKRILQKMQKGEDLTDKEQKIVDQWLAKQGQPDDSGGPTATGGGDPCRVGGHAIVAQAATKDTYVAMAAAAQKTWSAKLPADGRAKLESVVSQAKSPTFGGDFALMLIAHGSGSAAVVSAAIAAQKKPDDAITANNLGVALRGMKDYGRATIALSYARSLAPDSPLVLSNLGWLAMSQGDANAAGTFFQGALSKDAELATALAGKALILQCAKKSAQALPLFRASMKAGYSRLAEAGVNSAEESLKNEKAKPQSPSPATYGPAGGGEPPAWRDPVMPETAQRMALAMSSDPSQMMRYEEYWTELVTRYAAESGAAAMAPKRGSAVTGNARHLVFAREYDKERFVLDDIRRIMARSIIDGPFDRAGKELERFKLANGCIACPGPPRKYDCKQLRARVESLYPGVRSKELAEWTEMRKMFADLYRFSQPWIARIHDPAMAAAEKAAMDEVIISNGAAFASILAAIGGEVEAAWTRGDDCERPSAPAPPKLQLLKKYKIDPEECKSGETHMNFTVVNLNADCDKMTLDIGEGVLVSGEYKFGKDWPDDQITIFAGAGGNAGLGPLSASAKTGAFITMQNGDIIDYGNQSSVGISAGYGPGSVVVEAGVRIAAASGLDMSIDANAGIAVPGSE
jgi:Flp pilus assembly protein TadD